MTVRLSKIRIIEMILQSSQKSFEKYRDITGSYGLGQAPESLLQVDIFHGLKKVSPYTTLEDTVRTVLAEGNMSLRGQKPRGSASGRFDIVLWDNQAAPKVIVEIKKAWEKNACNRDAKRIRDMLSRDGSEISYGILVAYAQTAKIETLNNRFNAIAKETRTKIKASHRVGPTKVQDEGELPWYWDVGCFVVSGR